MSDGTLLGSYVFHDIIPWDDDIDFMVDIRDYPKLKTIFQNKTIWSKYQLHGFHDATNEYTFNLLSTVFPDRQGNTTRYHKVKIFPTTAKRTHKYPWNWPFIDITFFKQNITHVWNHNFRNKQFF